MSVSSKDSTKSTPSAPALKAADSPTTAAAADCSTDDDDELVKPAGHELKPVDTNTSTYSVGSTRELKPKREKDWRETFLPDASEELVETHGCALAKDILVHGRMFVSRSRVYFKSNILGFKTAVNFPFESITAIEPKMTALVIPNAIEMTVAGGETYLFTTLNARDETLDLLLALWRSAAPDKFSAFAGSKDAEEAAEYRARAASVSSIQSPDGVNTVRVEKNSPGGAHFEMEAKQPIRNGVIGGGTPVSEDGGASGGGHPETKAEGIEDFEELCMDAVFPCEPKKIFDLWYRDEKFILGLWEKLEFTDIDCPSFPEPEKERDYSYTKPLKGSFGPSSTQCCFHDKVLNEEPEKFFAILTVTETPNVPSGKSFKCKSLTTFTWAGGNKGVRVRATSEVEWSGRSMIKGVVNSSSIAGQKEYNEALEKETREYVKGHPDMKLSGADDSAAAPPTPSDKEDKAEGKDAKGGSVVEALLEDPVKLVLGVLVVVLLLSNSYLLLTRGTSHSGPKQFRGNKHEVQGAMARLDRMEREWNGLRAHFSGEAASVVSAPAVAVPDTQPVKVEAGRAAHRRQHN